MTCILDPGTGDPTLRPVEMHTMEDAVAVGHWLEMIGAYIPMRIMDADPAFQGNVIMDEETYRIRVEQYGEKVEDDGFK
jgi:hypothetical protein